MKLNNDKELKEAILKEVNKIAKAEYKKAKISLGFSHWWCGGFVAGYLYRVTEVIKQAQIEAYNKAIDDAIKRIDLVSNSSAKNCLLAMKKIHLQEIRLIEDNYALF